MIDKVMPTAEYIEAVGEREGSIDAPQIDVSPSSDVNNSSAGALEMNVKNHSMVIGADDTVDNSSNIRSLMNCRVGSPIQRVLCPNDVLSYFPDELVDRQDDCPPKISLLDGAEEFDEAELDEITDDSNLRDPNRRICIVTTAALPWRTGTAVNPLLRALYLTRGRSKHHVTLVIPWLNNEKSRVKLYGKECNFSSRQEQEEWIRDYCRSRAHCAEEEANLKIEFYESAYHDAFGSIFPSVDICGLIPTEEADICILEEPEHLNWFRIPHVMKRPSTMEKVKAELNSVNDDTEHSSRSNATANELHGDKEQLGWAYKFRHVVGILHTNYGAYMTQYSIGTSVIAAPAITIMSSIVVRAYCHKVIRLSDVLPSLAPNKEVTCNVHGVRSEFLDPPQCNEGGSDEELASVYFIGKLIWAKGFDKLLEMQEIFKQKTGGYFKMDVYGGGSDEKAISRAFLGRRVQKLQDQSKEVGLALSEKQCADDAKAARIFGHDESIKKVLEEHSEIDESEHKAIEVTRSPSGKRFKVVEMEDDTHPFVAIVEQISLKSAEAGVSTSKAVYRLADSILQAGLKMTFSTRPIENDEAARTGTQGEEGTKSKFKSLYFDPPRSKYEFRSNPIPARFLGVKDHAVIRDIPAHKIFLNMSTTEVLCTTTAEALAMGKFAIIPKHPSNTFFLQFPNCLAYETMDECVERLSWALENKPTPLTEEDLYKFTWEGATERLFKAGAITKREMRERVKSGADKADTEVAWFHVESAKKGKFLTNFFSGFQSLGTEPDNQVGKVANGVP